MLFPQSGTQEVDGGHHGGVTSVWERDSLGSVSRSEARTFAGEALEVEVLALHPQHLPFTWLLALVARDQGLLGGVVLGVLRMSHWKQTQRGETQGYTQPCHNA